MEESAAELRLASQFFFVFGLAGAGSCLSLLNRDFLD